MRAALLALIALAAPAAAQDAVGTLVSIGSRLFLVGEVPSASTTLEDLLPLTRVRWEWRMIQDDPVLDGAVVHIERPPSPPAYLFGPEGVAKQFPDRSGCPSRSGSSATRRPATRARSPAGSCSALPCPSPTS